MNDIIAHAQYPFRFSWYIIIGVLHLSGCTHINFCQFFADMSVRRIGLVNDTEMLIWIFSALRMMKVNEIFKHFWLWLSKQVILYLISKNEEIRSLIYTDTNWHPYWKTFECPWKQKIVLQTWPSLTKCNFYKACPYSFLTFVSKSTPGFLHSSNTNPFQVTMVGHLCWSPFLGVFSEEVVDWEYKFVFNDGIEVWTIEENEHSFFCVYLVDAV